MRQRIYIEAQQEKGDVPGKVDHTLGKANLAKFLILLLAQLAVMICIFPVALGAGLGDLGVVEDDLIAEGLVCISQRRIVYSQKRELGWHNLRKVCSYPRHWRGWRSPRIYLLTSFLL